MRVLVTNSVVLNGGDMAILEAVLEQVQGAFGPDVEVRVESSRADVARRYYPDLPLEAPLHTRAVGEKRPPSPSLPVRAWAYAAWRTRWWIEAPRCYLAAYLIRRGRPDLARRVVRAEAWEALRDLAGYDLVISTGGTYLVENYWLVPVLFNYRVALLLGKPLVFYTQSMGPFTRPRYRRALRSIFRAARLVLLRDERSRRHLEEVAGPLSHAHVLPDVAFGLARPERLTAAQEAAPSQGRPLRVAVSVREWPYFKERTPEAGMAEYEDAVAAAVTALVERHGAEVAFLSTCQGVPEYRYDDGAVAERIADRLSPEVRRCVQVDRQFHPPEELLERLGTFDLVVATRMHMAILALVAGVPVLPIAYEFKTKALFERLGLGEWVQDIERVTPSGLTSASERLLGRLDELRRSLFEGVERLRREALAAQDLLADAVSKE